MATTSHTQQGQHNSALDVRLVELFNLSRRQLVDMRGRTISNDAPFSVALSRRASPVTGGVDSLLNVGGEKAADYSAKVARF